ncbi:MAG: hypothetical protein WAN48_01500 [Actinomycetes bacterium]
MSVLQALALFVALPLAVYALVTLLVHTPSWTRAPKYRPGLPWFAEPVWIGGGDAEAARTAEPVTEGGGCSARW